MNTMYKQCFLLLFICSASYAQNKTYKDIEQDFIKIKSVKEATVFQKKDTTVHCNIYSINTLTDTTDNSTILSYNIGEIQEYYSIDSLYKVHLKLISADDVMAYRVSYIYLDNNKLSLQEIKALRETIQKRLDAGERFEKLALEYSMDGNAKKGGDLGWFQKGQMDKGFEKAVIDHKKDEVYVVDIPQNKWYYTVKNTFEPIQNQIINYMVVWLKR